MGSDFYDKIVDVEVGKFGQYFKPGLYKVRIIAVKEQKSQVGSKEFFIIETEVLESNNSEIKVGSERSQVINMAQVMALPNIKQFMAAVSGVDATVESVNEDVENFWLNILGEHTSFGNLCNLVVGEANPLSGTEMMLECVEILTKEKKQPFTIHRWQPREV